MQEAIKQIKLEIEKILCSDWKRLPTTEILRLEGQTEGLQRAIEILKEVQNERDNQKD